MNDLTSTLAGSLPALHAAVTWYLVGLSWIVQRVHYPLFEKVGADAFRGYEQTHVARITPVVAPAMLLEVALAVALWWAPPPDITPGLPLAGLALVGVVWGSTFGIQVPCHRVLEGGFEAEAHRRLVATNWIRTVAWTLRGGIALALL